MLKTVILAAFLYSLTGFSQILDDFGSESKPAVDALKCRDPRFRMVSDCANTVYYDEDRDAYFHKKAGSPYTGSCKVCHMNGNVEMYLTFSNGKPVGQDTIYYENGQINLIRSHDSEGLGKEDGKWMFYREDGSLKWEKNYSIGMAEGEHRYYFEDSTLQKVEVWHENKLNGKKQEFWENGNIKKEIDYKNGEWDGVYKTYFKNGKAESQQEFVKGKKNGLSTYYYDNGSIFYTENHSNGCREGEFKRFYATDGRKWTVENYKNDQRHGLFEEYYDNDKNVLKYKAIYKKGVLVEEHYYDEFGDETSAPEDPNNSFKSKQEQDDLENWPLYPTEDLLEKKQMTRKEYDKARKRYFKNKKKQEKQQEKNQGEATGC